MREAYAGTPQDLSSRSSGARRGKSGKGKPRAGWLRRFGARRPGTSLILGLAAIAAIGVPLNALYFQDGRHPAPLFAAIEPAAQAPVKTAEAPLPPARPAAAALQQAKAAPAKPEGGKTEVAKAETSRARELRDPISLLLGAGAPKAEAPAEKAEKPDKKVRFAQKALAKLGYPLRPDGMFGGTTRQAIEKFERSIGAPVKGELTPQILRQITSRSGLAPQ